jgi:hypothetical protein
MQHVQDPSAECRRPLCSVGPAVGSHTLYKAIVSMTIRSKNLPGLAAEACIVSGAQREQPVALLQAGKADGAAAGLP